MFSKPFIQLLRPLAVGLGTVVLFASCGSSARVDNRNKMLISVKDQRMVLVRDGDPVKSYKVSTSKFGVGNTRRSKRTPLGKMRIAKKIGGGARSGSVFKGRRRTGEVLRPNAPGRDPIVSRILWLRGTEYRNRHTYGRYIYIHGTPEEYKIGRPASYGCIRMRSRDVIDLYKRVGVGAEVVIVYDHLSKTSTGRKYHIATARNAGPTR